MNLLIPTLPSHFVIVACELVGFNSPLDHPWVELPETRDDPHVHSCDCYKQFGRGQSGKCYLQIEVPLRGYRFITEDGESRYVLGQCVRCKTMFWSEAR
ncbi:MAG TPA: hypothetical protein VGK19_21805 [Capsulimonadaceae bacterium]|jgi:hypothetical protein